MEASIAVQDSTTWSHDLTGYFIYLVLSATLGPLLFGYHLAELNAPQGVLTCAQRTLAPNSYLSPLPQCIPMSSLQYGLVVSAFTVGGLVGALSISPIANKHGRLQAMRYTTILFTLGPLAEALAPFVAILVIGRFISGLAAGAAVVVAPIYVSEITLPKYKGFFGSFTQVMTNLGILITNLLGFFLSHGQMWRVILGVGGVIGLNQLAALFFAMESPKWLADRGETMKAKKVLEELRAEDFDVNEEFESWGYGNTDPYEGREDPVRGAITRHDSGSGPQHDAEEEAGLLENSFTTSSPNSSQPNVLASRSHRKHRKDIVGIWQVLSDPRYRPASIAVMGCMLAQQFCGINSIVMYGVDLLSNLLGGSSALLNVFIAGVNLVATLGFAPLTDRLGRKPCLLMSIGGMGICSILLGASLLLSISILSAVAALAFVAAFALGLGPIPFLLASELATTESVGATQSCALAANWISTFIIAQFFPLANKQLGGKVHFIFAGFAALSWLFVLRFVPETKGKKNADEVWGREPARRHGD